jgi:hypothetical protein
MQGRDEKEAARPAASLDGIHIQLQISGALII